MSAVRRRQHCGRCARYGAGALIKYKSLGSVVQMGNMYYGGITRGGALQLSGHCVREMAAGRACK